MKNAKGVSHTGTMRGQYHADEAAALFFTGMTPVELTDLKLDTGKRWIMNYCKANAVCSEGDAAELWMEPTLLQWWNLEWRRMDHYIILPVLYKIVEGERENVYREMHCDVFLSHHPSYGMLELALMRVLKFGNLVNKKYA